MSEYVLRCDNMWPGPTTYVVAPCPANKIEQCDLVRIMRFNETSTAILQDIHASGAGRGNVLLYAAVTLALNNGLTELMGRMMTTTPDLTREWYRRRRIVVGENNIFNTPLIDVWSACATIMESWGDSYSVENLS